MNKKIFATIALVGFVSVSSYGQSNQKDAVPKMTPEMTEQWEPIPQAVIAGNANKDVLFPAPSDAIVLFGGANPNLAQWIATPDKQAAIKGKDLSKFISSKGNKEAKWNIEDGNLVVNKKVGDIQTKDNFKDFQLHIEWKVPADIKGEGQLRGNSGIFLQGNYELQVLDSYNNPTYVNGMVGSIYKQIPPLVNAVNKPGEWNVYDIIFTAPTFSASMPDKFRTPPYVTVLLNGVLVQNHTIIKGATRFIGIPTVPDHDAAQFMGEGPIRLQAHGDDSKPISYRNIWIRPL